MSSQNNENNKKHHHDEKIVSAYDEQGNPKPEYGPQKLSKGFKVFLFFVYVVIGPALAIGVILLLERCSG
ncbi:MAG: hypothetical protein WC282_02965 [Bacilli bacterium]|jgi:hypothetical protein